MSLDSQIKADTGNESPMPKVFSTYAAFNRDPFLYVKWEVIQLKLH